jgi:hypothetical protein|uniref:Uncharacterized protein n=1 Tax=Sipha flava TaxID=143950 RepID=A0A2S2PVP5_9HEMI
MNITDVSFIGRVNKDVKWSRKITYNNSDLEEQGNEVVISMAKCTLSGIILTPGFSQFMVSSQVRSNESVELLPETLDFLEAFAAGGKRFNIFLFYDAIIDVNIYIERTIKCNKLILILAW